MLCIWQWHDPQICIYDQPSEVSEATYEAQNQRSKVNPCIYIYGYILGKYSSWYHKDITLVPIFNIIGILSAASRVAHEKTQISLSWLEKVPNKFYQLLDW